MPPSRSSRPWLALVAAVVVVLAALGYLVWSDGAADEPLPDTNPVGLPAQPEDRRTDVDPIPTRASTAEATPIPGVREGEAARAAGLEEYETPLTVFGWVEDGAERRQPDVEVNLFDDLGEYLDSVITDDDGQFALSWDEPLTAGWSVGTEPDPYLESYAVGTIAPAIYVHGFDQVPGSPPVQCTLVLMPAPRIDGFVYDAATRAPIELADVEAVSLSPAWVDEFQDTFTEEDGTFSLSLVDLPATGLLLRVMDDEDRVALVGPFDLGPGEVRYVEIGLAEPLTITGIVSSGNDGSPIDGAEIWLVPPHAAFDDGENWDITWDDGTFELEDVTVPANQIWLYVEAEDHGPAVVKVEDPLRPVAISMGLIVNITGTIVEAGSGEPVEDAEVRFVLSGPGGPIDDYEDIAYTDDDGVFELPLEYVPPAHAEVLIETGEHVRYRKRLSELVRTDLDWREYELEIELEPIPEV